MESTELVRGITTAADTATATSEAVRTARGQLTDPDSVELAVVFASAIHDVETIVDTVREQLGPIKLFGSTTAGEFTDDRVTSGGLAVGLIASDHLHIETALADGVSEDIFGTVERAVADLPETAEMDGEYTAAVTVHSGLTGKGEQISLVTNQVLGDIPLAGGSAGDDLGMEQTLVFTEDGIADDGVAIAVLSGDQPFGLGVEHGHEPISETYEVTRAEENIIYELGGEPAFDVWKREVAAVAAAEYGIDVDSLTAEDRELFDLLTRFELGVPIADGAHKIRWPGMTDRTTGPLAVATAVPEGTEVRITHSPTEAQIDSAQNAAEQALAEFEGDGLAGALVFDCGCREIILGSEFDRAVEGIADVLPAQFVGFETYGEVCMPPDSASGYHNATTSVLLLPE
ncbi:FIST signal transduction protein [Halovenus sp. HT40]|uniref:FIST signal transduction protein n=1 Tax=Halovenus sp. HT40 TaxID=3126691 RepID=UPI00300F5BE1